VAKRKRWSPDEASRWYTQQPWLVGCNFIPSGAVNQLEMWQEATFDEESNDRELGWAADLGFNTVRVYLHDLPWKEDPEGFMRRVDRFLSIADGHGIRTMFVLFDGVWDPEPVSGEQRAPRPQVHNSGWVQSPGSKILGDPARHDELEPYVTGIIARFSDDERILAWDLFNEPDNLNPAYADRELPNKRQMAMALLTKSFGWAREAGASQPLTSGLWRPKWVNSGELSEMDELQLGESDLISCHLYVGRRLLEARFEELAEYGRPVFVTEFLARPFGSTFEKVLPILKERRVGGFCWGLVSGKTQTIYGWDSWTKDYDAEPDVWFHDVLRPDGTPYRDEEADLIRELTVGAVD
jgi:hypothetical protein